MSPVKMLADEAERGGSAVQDFAVRKFCCVIFNVSSRFNSLVLTALP